MQKLFSIIIPTYKGEESLSIALESINQQTYKNIEVIVSDDNGRNTDSQKLTEKIVEKYKNKLNIKYLVNEHINGSHARNEGLKIAKGDFISFLDDDDFYLETYVEDTIDALKNTDIVFFDVVIISEENIYRKVSSPLIDSKELLFTKQEIGTGSNICFTRNVVDDGNLFDERYQRHQDIEFACKLIKKYKYKWIKKTNIVKYFNNINNYPEINNALTMQRLLRDDMLTNKIIDEKEYEELISVQLHGLYNDYLVKNAAISNIDSVYKKLKESALLSIKDKAMYIVYKTSKKFFNRILNMYIKSKLQENDNRKEEFITYRNKLIEKGY